MKELRLEVGCDFLKSNQNDGHGSETRTSSAVRHSKFAVAPPNAWANGGGKREQEDQWVPEFYPRRGGPSPASAGSSWSSILADVCGTTGDHRVPVPFPCKLEGPWEINGAFLPHRLPDQVLICSVV